VSRISRGLVDVLAHLADPRVVDVASLLSRAAAAGVTDVVHAGTDPFATEPRITHTHVRVHRAHGLHPLFVDAARVDEQLRALDARVTRERPIALGECGLDGRARAPAKEAQERALVGALAIARHHAIPVVFHVVKASQPFLDVKDRFPEVKGVVHGFSGAPEMARALVERGLLVSFGGLVTHARAARARRAATTVPLSHLLVESDTPDHPAGGHEASEPAQLTHTLATLAALRGDDVEDLARATAENARALFALSV
jgi:TatD DNase family protein